jgi:hypothetical protein
MSIKENPKKKKMNTTIEPRITSKVEEDESTIRRQYEIDLKITIITSGEPSCNLCSNPNMPVVVWAVSPDSDAIICLECLEHIGFTLHHHEEKEEVEY